MKKIGIIIFFGCLFSCGKKPSGIDFPYNETEFSPPIIKHVENPESIKVKPLIISFDQNRPDSIKPPKIIVLKNPKVIPVITNEKHLGKPTTLPFKESDSIYYFNEASKKELQKKYLSKTLVKAQEPTINKIKPKLFILGQPEKVTCKSAKTTDNPMYNINFYDQDQGLAGSYAVCSCFDDQGNLWVGTDGGLCKFDGKEWWIYRKKLGLSNIFIRNLTKGSNGRLLISTASGDLNILDYENQIVKHYPLTKTPSATYVKSISENLDGEILIANDDGLTVLDETRELLKKYNLPQEVKNKRLRKMTTTRDGDIILADDGGGIYILGDKKQSLKKYANLQGLTSKLVTSIVETPDKQLIIGTYGGGIIMIDTKAKILKNYAVAQGLDNLFVSSLFVSRQGQILLGTTGGLYLLDQPTQTLKLFTTEEGLSDNFVLSLLETNNDKYIIGTVGGLNIMDLKNYSFKHYFTKHGLSYKDEKSLFESKNGNLLIGSSSGFLILDETKQNDKNYSSEQGLTTNKVTCLLESSEGNICIGTEDDGIYIFDNDMKNFKHYNTDQGLSSNYVKCIIESREGNIIFGTKDGCINIFENKNERLKRYPALEGLSINDIFSLKESDEGNLLIGTWGGGFRILDYKNHSIKNYSTANGLSNKYVISILETHDGDILIGTYDGGINILNKKQQRITHYSTNQGLPSETVLSICKDSLGYIWLGTGKGLCKMAKKNGKYFVQKNFNKLEGLKNINYDLNAMTITKKGKLWAVAGSVLSEFNPYYHIDTVSPSIFINSIDVMEKKIDWYTDRKIAQHIKTKDTIWSTNQDTFYINGELPEENSYFTLNKINYSGVTKDLYHLPKNLELPFDQNHLTFHFTGICIAPNADRIRYRYILDGFDQAWSPITEKSEVDYRNIPFGKYVFKVAARSVNGYWSKPIEFTFEVIPPWYQRKLAYFAYCITLLLLLYLYNFIKNLQQRKLSEFIISSIEKEKKLISQELHDDLGQNLLYLKLSSTTNIDLISKLIEDTRRISRNLFPHKIEDRKLKDLVENLIIETAVISDIKFHYDIQDVEVVDNKIKLNLYRIIQEATTNIIKHSKAENARIDISYYENKLYVEISDDGKGFNYLASFKSNSLGLTSMKERAYIINANIYINSRINNTIILLTMKI